MFEISDDAMELLLARLEAALVGRPELRRSATPVGLRLNFGRGSAFLSLSRPRPTDQVISFMGRTLLIIVPGDFSRLERARLTVEREPTGNRLSLEPNSPEQTVQSLSIARSPRPPGRARGRRTNEHAYKPN